MQLSKVTVGLLLLTISVPVLAQHGGGGGMGGTMGGGIGTMQPSAPPSTPALGDRDRLRDMDRLKDQDKLRDQDRLRDQTGTSDGDRDRDRDRDRLQTSQAIEGSLSSWELLTNTERQQFQQQMRAARTEQERNTTREQHRATITARARDLGVDAPFGPAGSRPGYAVARMLTEEERLQFHQRMRSASTEAERQRLRNQMQETARERAREMGVDIPEWFGQGPGPQTGSGTP